MFRNERWDDEGRRLASEAYELWRTLSVERQNAYSDRAACLLAGRMAVEATRWEDGLVILEGIRRYMDEFSSPRKIPGWARVIGDDKRTDFRRDQRIQERREAEEIEDPEVRRVMLAFARSRARGENVQLVSVICVVCKQFTEGKCQTCARPVHQRACHSRHECVEVA